MSKRPTVVKPASEGSKRIVMKAWNDLNSGKDHYEVDSIEQVVESTEEKPKKTTRSKRPNRNTQKKPRTTKKSAKKEIAGG